MELPSENGAKVANEWQPISALIWVGPISRCASFIAAKTGRSGQPVQKFGGRGGRSATGAVTAGLWDVNSCTRAATAAVSTPVGWVWDKNAERPRRKTSE